MHGGKSLVAAGVLAVALLVGCGGGGGGGGGSNVVVDGTVATASTVASDRNERRWLAWIGEEIVGLAKRVYAQATNTSLDGIEVTVSGNGDTVTATTGVNGTFSFGSAPNGNVTAAFSRDSCAGQVSLPDVTTTSVVTLENIVFDCAGARPARVSETFQGVARNKPASQSEALSVCVSSGGSSRTRVVLIQGATIENDNGNEIPFSDLLAGDRILVTGARQALGTSSTVDAQVVRVLGGGSSDPCGGSFGPTPTSTPTTTSAATATATPTPTPTETP